MSKAIFHGNSCTVVSETGVVREYFPVGDTWVSDEIFPFVADTVQTRVFDVSRSETSSAVDSSESTTTAGEGTVTVQANTYTRRVTY